jgi:hypothetical protein
MLKRFGPIALLATATGGTVLVCLSLGASHQVLDLVVIGAALVAGCMVDLRPAGRAPLPVALAIIPVLLRAATPDEFVVVVAAAALVAAVSRRDLKSIGQRLLLLAELLAAAYGAGAVFRAITASTSSSSRVGVLGALAAAAITEIVVADLVALERDRRIAGLRDRAADVVVVSSGMLMAVGYGGLAGHGRLGLWGPMLFSIPLLAAWYSFELLGRTRRTFRQTVQALGVAPELGGLTHAGHVERVAVLAVAIGQELGIPATQLEDLETAAWLHHLGAVCLDQSATVEQPDSTAVAHAGAEMLRASQALASAGDIVAAEPSLHRPPTDRSEFPSALMGQVLKVASAYDELTGGDASHAAWAVDALFTGPAYVYDGRVLTALEQVLSTRGRLT